MLWCKKNFTEHKGLWPRNLSRVQPCFICKDKAQTLDAMTAGEKRIYSEWVTSILIFVEEIDIFTMILMK